MSLIDGFDNFHGCAKNILLIRDICSKTSKSTTLAQIGPRFFYSFGSKFKEIFTS